ncbi:hypothetical protein B0H13DRAFT_2366308 [Mycena leptocephala]|nr:hypothetical protein B0H13DRAFT_2366308 [Mycena leptocephala]
MAPAPEPPVLKSSASRSTTPQPDIDSKMRLYGAIAAMRCSRLPTNAQITDALDYVKARSPVDEKKLSSEGRKLVGDIRDVLSTFSGLLQEKNKGEILQRFVWETRGVDTSSLKASEASHHLRTLLSLVLTNAEMRKLITDAGTVGRDLLAKGTAKAAEAVSPKPEQLARADDPAPHDHFHEELDPSVSTSSLSDSSSSESESSPSPDDGKKSLLGRIQSLHSSNKPALDDGRAWLADEFFPGERRERWIWRGKKVIVECQKHKDYQESVRWLLDTIDAWAAQSGRDPSLRTSIAHLRTLLERIANASLDPFFAAANVLAADAAKDEGLRKWWTQLLPRSSSTRVTASSTRARELRDTGRAFYHEKYKDHFYAVVDAASTWFKAIAEDPLNKALAQDFARLTRDLLFDGEGNLQFKKNLWEDVRGVILPTLVDKVGYIRSLRVEYTDDSFDLIVENLALSGHHLFPNIVEVEAHNFVRFSPYATKSKDDASCHEFTFTFAQMHADMRDVAFSFRTKTGPIRMRDSGLADVVLGSEGLTVRVSLRRICSSRARAHVKVGSVKFSIRDSKHDVLYKVMKQLATRLIKKQIQKALADAIRTGFEYIDGQLVGARDRMAKAKASDDGSRREVLAELFKRKKEMCRRFALANSGHPAAWVIRAAEKEQLAGQGDEWRSEAFDIQLPKMTPGSQPVTVTA